MERQGFTLLELSIVLVIIGLIIGGITVGQNLIRSAELNKVVSDLKKYETAVHTFKLKYNALPGDMDNASSYWPTCDATPANCNGNKDGRIDNQLVWLHLSLSGVISGNYAIKSGILSAIDGTPGVDYPHAAIKPGGVLMWALSGVYQEATARNMIMMAAKTAVPFPNLGGFLNAVDASTIDTKMDDNHPAYGNLKVALGITGGATTCASVAYNGDPTLAAWDFSNSGATDCWLAYYLD